MHSCERSYKGLQLVQLLARHGVLLTSVGPCAATQSELMPSVAFWTVYVHLRPDHGP